MSDVAAIDRIVRAKYLTLRAFDECLTRRQRAIALRRAWFLLRNVVCE